MDWDRAWIERYAAGAAQLGPAIAGLTAADLHARPVPGAWTIQQIILHLLDSDLIASDRMKRIIAEDNPQLIGFDESRFAENLFYEHLDVQTASTMFQLNRELTAAILRRLPLSAFARFGTHSERGAVTLADLVETYVNHLDHHLKFVADKRKLLGK